jgi:hypothetical protein
MAKGPGSTSNGTTRKTSRIAWEGSQASIDVVGTTYLGPSDGITQGNGEACRIKKVRANLHLVVGGRGRERKQGGKKGVNVLHVQIKKLLWQKYPQSAGEGLAKR